MHRRYFKDQDLDGRIILKWFLRFCDLRVGEKGSITYI